MRKLFSFVLMISLAFAFSYALAQEDGKSRKYDQNELFEKFFKATDEKEQKSLVELINNLNTQDDIVERLTKGREYKADVKTGWISLKTKCIDKVTRPYHLYIPEDYDPKKEYMMMFDLHGGISRPAVISEEMLTERHQFWGEFAKEHKMILAIPTGQIKAEWWSNVGGKNVLSIIEYVKRNYNVNENKIFCTGFSDGGSGSYYMAATENTPFAGFVPLNGHPGVAQMGGRQIQLPNFGNKPMYVVNTEKDQLYPAEAIKSLIKVMKKAGGLIEFITFSEYGHSPQYLWDEKEFENIYKWMEKTERKPYPKKLIWETSDANFGRLHWLNILKIKDVGNNEKFEDFNFTMKQTRVLLGILIEQEYYGIGVKIKEVQEGTLAEEMKLKADDIIIGIDDDTCDGVDDLRLFLNSKTFGDEIKIKVKRGEETLEFEGKFPEAIERTLFSREKEFGSISTELKENTINVKVKYVEQFELYLSSKMVDFSKPVIVNVNGEKYIEQKLNPNGKFMLEQFLADNDRKMVFEVKLTINVKPKKEKDETPKTPKEEDF